MAAGRPASAPDQERTSDFIHTVPRSQRLARVRRTPLPAHSLVLDPEANPLVPDLEGQAVAPRPPEARPTARRSAVGAVDAFRGCECGRHGDPRRQSRPGRTHEKATATAPRRSPRSAPCGAAGSAPEAAGGPGCPSPRGRGRGLGPGSDFGERDKRGHTQGSEALGPVPPPGPPAHPDTDPPRVTPQSPASSASVKQPFETKENTVFIWINAIFSCFRML